jgi:energy-coupling factor transporter ATP-binding protein EcfA2
MLHIKDLKLGRNILSVFGFILFIVWIIATKYEHWLKDYMEAYIGITGCLAIFFHFLMLRWDTNNVEQNEVIPEATYQKNYEILKNELIDQYQTRINSKFAFQMVINMGGKPTTYGTSEGYANDFQLNKDLTIEYDDISEEISKILYSHGRLLIIGEAGSGKTTILLSAAISILRNEKKGDLPYRKINKLPLTLNLATWQSDFRFEEWYERNITESYNQSNAFVKTLIQHDAILPFFDGYDEVAKHYRADLLKKMRTYFGSNNTKCFVISSRKLAYKDVDIDAPVYAEYEVKPLTIKQIQETLTSSAKMYVSGNALLNAINKNASLREAVLNPFYLDTASFLFNKGIELAFKATDTEGIKAEIVRMFVENQVPNVRTKKYLHFLANKMNKKGIVVFELLRIQPDWSNNNRKNQLYIVLSIILIMLLLTFSISGVVGALFFMAVSGLFSYIIYSLLAAMIIILFFMIIGAKLFGKWGFVIGGLIGGWISTTMQGYKIQTTDIQVWRWKNVSKNFRKCFRNALLFALFWGLIFFGINNWKIDILIGCVIGSFIYGFISAIINAGIIASNKISLSNPYQRFLGTLKFDFLKIGLGLLSFLLGFLTISIMKDGWSIHQIIVSMRTIPLEKLCLLMILLIGLSLLISSRMIEHIIIRFVLWKEGHMPLRIVSFMDKMTDQHIIEDNRLIKKQKGSSSKKQRGVSWRFRHKILQDYFADMKFDK